MNSQLCLDVDGGVAANGTNVQISSCNGTNAQKWEMLPDGTIHSTLDPSYCLDVTYSGTANGTNVQVYQCNGTNAQKWTLTGS